MCIIPNKLNIIINAMQKRTTLIAGRSTDGCSIFAENSSLGLRNGSHWLPKKPSEQDFLSQIKEFRHEKYEREQESL